jgi:hypothetical protein
MDSPASFHEGPFYPFPMTSGPEIKAEDVPPYIPYDQPYTNSWAYQDNTQYGADPVNYYDTSSCVDAANNIQPMRSEAEVEYQADLVYRFPGQESRISNLDIPTVFHRHPSLQGA